MDQVVSIQYSAGEVEVVRDLDAAVERMEASLGGPNYVNFRHAGLDEIAAVGIVIPKLHACAYLVQQASRDLSIDIHDLKAHRNASTSVATYDLSEPMDPDTLVSCAIIEAVQFREDEESAVERVRDNLETVLRDALKPGFSGGLTDAIEKQRPWKLLEDGCLPDLDVIEGLKSHQIVDMVVETALTRFDDAMIRLEMAPETNEPAI